MIEMMLALMSVAVIGASIEQYDEHQDRALDREIKRSMHGLAQPRLDSIEGTARDCFPIDYRGRRNWNARFKE